MVNWVIDLDCLTDPEPRLQEKAKFKNPPQLNREVWHRICWKGLSGAIRGHERAQRSNGACSNAAHLIRICMPLFLTLQRAWSDYKGEQLPPGERGACNVRPRFFARQNAAGILRRCKWVVGDGDPRPDANSEQLEGRRCAGGGSRKISDPQMLLLHFCLLLNCGSLGRGGADWSAPWPINWEAQRPLTPMMMQGDRANGERWLASSYSSWICHQWCSRVEKGSVDPNSAPPPQFFAPPSSFIIFCGRFFSLSFLQNFSINRLNIDILL